MNDDIVEAAHERQRLSVLHKQLIISLKFHHSQTLEQIPLEMAVQAVIEVWESCHKTKLKS
ncbi:MAG: hypothetical protein HC934_06080 [Acaryochloridaceae cyanobacterium SU_2_1]|nr:hypothetical protein [Acaryochloridaceae cyanobacterium SU_2_1]